jgi:hypothetical protein
MTDPKPQPVTKPSALTMVPKGAEFGASEPAQGVGTFTGQ